MEKKFWVDGACSGNPGPGGYGVVGLEDNIITYWYSSFENETTNNRMELSAILHVIKMAADDPDNEYVVYSDSIYAINSITMWIFSWAANGWVRTGNKPVENLDIMKEIYSYISDNLWNFKLCKVSGHSGVIGNELADAGATKNLTKIDNIVKKVGLKWKE